MKIATMKNNALERYYKEIELLSEIDLEKGEKWDLASTLRSGGAAVFPHAYFSKCGHQIAAVVRGCLDCGADQVLVLGVVHTLTEKIREARTKERRKEESPLRGVFPSMENEYSLFYFKFLWDLEVKRRGIKPPELIMRYPFLVNRDPATLPGIKELEAYAKDSAVVITADLCHYGVAYGHQERKEDPHAYAEASIKRGFEVLREGSYADYYDICIETKSDSLDTCSVLKHLLGPLFATILEIEIVDSSDLFVGDPSPSFVAASLVELKKSIA